MLRDLNIPFALNTSKDDLIENFFVPLLKNSVQYDRGVGYFSSGWIKEAFEGMCYFAKNGGKARWITSPILSQDDWDALSTGNEAKENQILKDSLETAVKDLSTSLKQDTLIALAWMIADEIITFKIAKPRNKLTSEYHAKTGVFTDSNDDSISFDGSYNDSINGLHNFETIKVFHSWGKTNNYVEEEKRMFERIWNNEDPNIQVYDIPEATKQNILKFRENSQRPYPRPEWVALKTIKNFAEEIKIPIPHIPEDIKLREYQRDAIKSWTDNNYQGIFEMATGTGKTFTAISASIQLLEKKGHLLIIVICPYIHLGQQWQKEMEKFGYRPVLVAGAKKKWLEPVYQLIRDFRAGRVSQGSIITTNASFLRSELRKIIEEYGVWDKVLLIADEMHHCGSLEMLKVLPEKVEFRLGLSATPIRAYDEFGTKQLLEYFGEIVYEFSLKQAIKQKFLTPYYYYPIPVHLYNDEFNEFIVLSKKLSKLFHNTDEAISEYALKIAIKRANVLNNSQAKVDWLRENIDSKNDYSYTLFYVGHRIFDEVRSLLGYEKRIPIHEFTHKQSLAERKKLIDRFSKGTIQAFVAMKCLDEGVDIPPTRTAYFLASSSVSREFVQRRGRILRNYKGKTYATVYDLISIPPLEYIMQGKEGENYNTVRSALRREFLRIKEFANLAENKHVALSRFIEIADDFDLLDL